MDNQNPQFKPGDRIVFDAEGSAQKPFGRGVVTTVMPNGAFRFQPVTPFGNNIKPINIRKDEETAK